MRCILQKEQYYIKTISNILPYTSIFVNGIERKIYAVYDEFRTINSNDKDYKYIIMACQEEINAGLIENLEEDK